MVHVKRIKYCFTIKRKNNTVVQKATKTLPSSIYNLTQITEQSNLLIDYLIAYDLGPSL